MRRRRITSYTASGLLLAILLALIVSPSAQAAESVSVRADLSDDLAAREAAGLPGYRSTVNAEQLTAAGGTTERGAWSAQKGAMAAKDVARYNIRAQVGLEQGMGALDPIRPFPSGSLLPQGLAGKIKMPRYTGLGLSNPSSLLLVPVTAGWEFRGSINDGVLSFAGMSSTEDIVCQQKFESGEFTGFVNWITDVDCTMWQAKQDFVPNLGVVEHLPGWQKRVFWWGGTPDIADPEAVVSFTGAPEGQTAVFQGVTEVLKTAGAKNFSTAFSFACKTAAGVVSIKSPGAVMLTAATVGGQVAYSLPSCATGSTLYAMGRQGTAGAVDTVTDAGITWRADGGSPLYFAPGTPLYDSGNSGNPTRTRECIQVGDDGLTYTGTTPPYTEEQIAVDGWPPPVCAALPVGVTSESLKIVEKSVGLPDKILVDQQSDATPDTDALLGENISKYCQTKICVLDLVIKTSGLTCFSQGEACIGWWDEENHGDAKYQCNYAGQNVAIGECALYSKIFDTQKRLAGNPYADPVTGEEIGKQTGPSIDKNLMGNLPRANFEGRDCFGAGFGAANPLQWVLRPLQCFGEWAAVPRESVVYTEAARASTAWDSTIFGKVPQLTAQFSAIPVFTGCSGVPIDIEQTWPQPWGIHWRLGDACSGSLATAAAVSRTVLGGLICLAGVLAILQYLGYGIGFSGFGRRS